MKVFPNLDILALSTIIGGLTMRALCSSLLQLIKNVILIAVFAYPITFIIQLLADNSLFSSYNLLLIHYVQHYGSWLLLFTATLIIAHSNENQIALMEKIRENHYLLEAERWAATSFISPTHLYYLFSPPTAVTSDQKSNAYDPFYIKVVNDFRDRVYSHIIPSRTIPLHKPNMIQIIGKPMTTYLFKHILNIALVISVIIFWNIPYLSSWYNLILFFIIYPTLKMTDFIIAFCYIQPTSVYKKIENQFHTTEPYISWDQLDPNSDFGQTILFSWKADSDKRQRDHNQLHSLSQHKIDYNSPGISCYPYPEKEHSFLEFKENSYSGINKIIAMPVISNHKNNVIPFAKRNKKI